VDENYMTLAANQHDFEGQFQKDYSAIDHQLQGGENETTHTGADVKILNNYRQITTLNERLNQPKTSNETSPNMKRSLNHN
jgi:hypothetical protein